MPVYRVTDPESGLTVKLTGDSPPTEAELIEIFASLTQNKQETAGAAAQDGLSLNDTNIEEGSQDELLRSASDNSSTGVGSDVSLRVKGGDQGERADNRGVRDGGIEAGAGESVDAGREIKDGRGIERKEAGETRGFGDEVLGVLDTGLSLAGGAITEPLAGLEGLRTLLFTDKDPSQAIEDARQFMSGMGLGQANTEAGKENIADIGRTLAPVGEALSKTEQALGKTVQDLTGSPALATIAHTLPTAILESLGVKGLKKVSRKGVIPKDELIPRNNKKALIAASPELQKLADEAADAYQVLEDSNIKIDPEMFTDMAQDIEKQIKGRGSMKTLTPKAFGLSDSIAEFVGEPLTPKNIENMRRLAGEVAGDFGNKSDARLGQVVIEKLDDLLDKSMVGDQHKRARSLYQRSAKVRVVEELINNAGIGASGMENGLRNAARQMLKNKAKMRGMGKAETAALRDLVEGSTAGNAAKFFGKFGISEGQATSMLGASVGSASGGTIGAAFGGGGGAAIGATLVPLIGQIAKKTSQRITVGNAAYVKALAAAGPNGMDIIKAYKSHTPMRKRKMSDLADLLTQSELGSIKLPKSTTKTGKMIEDAVFYAKAIDAKMKQAAIGVTMGSLQSNGEDNER